MSDAGLPDRMPLRTSDYDECDARHPYGPFGRFEPTPVEMRGFSSIVLCLSGGGFRATAYHLGACRRLYELGVLQHVDEIRAVSGGGFLAAALANALSGGTNLDDLDWELDVAGPVRAFLRKDLRTLPILLTAPVNWAWKAPRLRLLERRVGQSLGRARMDKLPTHPRFVFLATDLLEGDLVALPNGISADEWPIVRAAVVSASLPPLFGPMVTRARSAPAEIRRVALADGGVWGNLGVSPRVLTSGRVVLVSDASYPLLPAAGGTGLRFWLARALRVTVQRGDSALRYQMWLNDGVLQRFELWRISETTRRGETGHVPEHSIEEQPFELSPEAVGRIARIRTDLDRFTSGEVEVLENHGYLRAASGMSWLLERIRRERADESGGVEEASAQDVSRPLEVIASQRYFPRVSPPHPEMLHDAQIMRALAGSEHRILKLRAIRRILG